MDIGRLGVFEPQSPNADSRTEEAAGRPRSSLRTLSERWEGESGRSRTVVVHESLTGPST